MFVICGVDLHVLEGELSLFGAVEQRVLLAHGARRRIVPNRLPDVPAYHAPTKTTTTKTHKGMPVLFRRRSLSVFVRPVGLCWGSAPVATALHAKYFAATKPMLWSALKVPGTSIMRASRTQAGSSSRSNLEGQKRRGKEIQTKLLSI